MRLLHFGYRHNGWGQKTQLLRRSEMLANVPKVDRATMPLIGTENSRIDKICENFHPLLPLAKTSLDPADAVDVILNVCSLSSFNSLCLSFAFSLALFLFPSNNSSLSLSLSLSLLASLSPSWPQTHYSNVIRRQCLVSEEK